MSKWDQVIGGVTMKFRGLDLAEEAGYADDIGLSRAEQDTMIRARMARARRGYRTNLEAGAHSVTANGMENSGVMEKVVASATGDLLAEGASAYNEAYQADQEVLRQERSTWMSMMADRDSQLNNARLQEAQREAQKKSGWDYIFKAASMAVPFIPGFGG